jgi:hypothetical protein
MSVEYVNNYNSFDFDISYDLVCSNVYNVSIFNEELIEVINIDNNNCESSVAYDFDIYEDTEIKFIISYFDETNVLTEEVLVNIDVDDEEPEIVDVWFVNSNGDRVESVSGNEMDVYLQFEYRDDSNISSISFDLSELSNPSNVVIPTSFSFNNDQLDMFCECNDTCICSHNFKIEYNTGNTAPSVAYEIEDEWGNIKSDNYIVNFNVDNQAPEIIDIYSDFCDDEKCYIKSGVNNVFIKTNDADENFNLKHVFYKIYGELGTMFVNNCSNGECLAKFGLNCVHGSRYKFMITDYNGIPTSDDVGNPLTGLKEKYFYCDNRVDQETESYVDNINIVSDNEFGLITGNSNLLISVIVKEDNGIKLARLNTSKLKDNSILELSSCNQIFDDGDNAYNCTFAVNSINNDYYETTLNFEFVDFANNTFEKDYNIEVLGSVGNYSVPKCFKFSSSDVRPGTVDRIALYLAGTSEVEYPLKVWSNFVEIDACFDPMINEVLPIDMNTCSFETNNGDEYSEISPFIYEFENFGKVGNDWVVRFSAKDQGHDVNEVENMLVKCNVSLKISTSTDVYEVPLVVPIEFEFKFRNSRLGEPGSKFAETIIEKSKTIESVHKYMSIADDILATLGQVCEIQSALSAFEGVGVGIEMVGDITAKVLPVAAGVGSQMTGVGNGMVNAAQGTSNGLYGDLVNDIAGLVKRSCNFVSCSGAKNMQDEFANNPSSHQEFFADYEDDNTGFDGTFTNYWNDTKDDFLTSSVDPYKSIIAAARANGGGVCLPGIFYHLRNFEQMECSILNCMRENARRGYNINECYNMRYTYICKQMINEAIEGGAALGVNGFDTVNQIYDSMDNVYSIVRNAVPKFFTSAWGTWCHNNGVTGDLGDDVSSVMNNEDFQKAKEVYGWDEDEADDMKEKYGDQTASWKIYFCHVPESINRFLDYTMNTQGVGAFQYTPLEVDMCDIALCTEEDKTKCETSSGFFPQLNGWSDYNIFGATGKFRMSSEAVDTSAIMKKEYSELKALKENLDDMGENHKDYKKYKREYNSKLSDFKKNMKNYAPDLRDSEVFVGNHLLAKYIDCKSSPHNVKCKDILETMEPNYNSNSGSSNNDGETVNDDVSLIPKSTYDKNKEYLDNYENIKNNLEIIKDYQEFDESAYKTSLYSEYDDVSFQYLENEAVVYGLAFDPGIDPATLKDKIINYRVEERKELVNEVSANEIPRLVSSVKSELGSMSDEDAYAIAMDLGVCKDDCDDNVIAARLKLLKDCSNGKSTDNYKPCDDFNLDQFESKLKEAGQSINKIKRENRKYDTYKKMEQRFGIMNKLTNILFQQQFMKDFVETLSTFGAGYDNPVFGFFEEFRSDNIVDSVCNLNSDIARSIAAGFGKSNVNSDSTFDCSGDYCETVLTISAEYMTYNFTDSLNPTQADAYLYTMAYYVGPVDSTVRYYIEFVDEDGESSYVSNDDERVHFVLNSGSVNTIERAWVSDNKYKKVCLTFDEDFPPQSGLASSKRKWCRDFSLQGFNTGEPVDVENLESGNSGSNGGGDWP